MAAIASDDEVCAFLILLFRAGMLAEAERTADAARLAKLLELLGVGQCRLSDAARRRPGSTAPAAYDPRLDLGACPDQLLGSLLCLHGLAECGVRVFAPAPGACDGGCPDVAGAYTKFCGFTRLAAYRLPAAPAMAIYASWCDAAPETHFRIESPYGFRLF
jgi:hypothetical protein